MCVGSTRQGADRRAGLGITARRAAGARPSSQSGVALITVLLVVALATVAAADMTRQTQLDLHRTGNRLANAQAREIALGGEQWAVSILARIRRSEDYQGVDARNQAWAQQLPWTAVEEAHVTGSIQDMQGRFNLNSLVNGNKVDVIALARFERMLESLEIDPEVAQAVIDWLDLNGDTTYPAGGEDDYYLALVPPYLAANRPATTASELRLIRGIDAARWNRLAPHVTALPESTPINVNTATPVVLQAIVPGLDRSAAGSLADRTKEEPFDTVDAFLEHRLVSDTANGRAAESGGLSVGSDYFRVRVDVEVGAIEYTHYSWLERGPDGGSRIFRRSRTEG